MAEDPTRPGEVVTKGKIKLPLWAWAVVGGVILGGGYLFYKRRQTAAAAAANTTATTPATATGYQSPTTILPMFQGTQPMTGQQFQQLQAANPPLPYSIYTVTGQGHYQLQAAGAPITDQWPAGAVISAYGLSTSDILNIDFYATILTLMNPGVTSPYPVGTKLRMPYNGTTTAPNTTPAPNTASTTPTS